MYIFHYIIINYSIIHSNFFIPQFTLYVSTDGTLENRDVKKKKNSNQCDRIIAQYIFLKFKHISVMIIRS